MEFLRLNEKDIQETDRKLQSLCNLIEQAVALYERIKEGEKLTLDFMFLASDEWPSHLKCEVVVLSAEDVRVLRSLILVQKIGLQSELRKLAEQYDVLNVKRIAVAIVM